MKVIKRDGSEESIKFDKISARVKKQTYGLNTDFVDHLEVSKKVISGVYDGVTTEILDELAAKTAANLVIKHPDYSILASRLAITSLKKKTKKLFSDVVDDLYNYVNPKNGKKSPMVSDELYNIVQKNKNKVNQILIGDRDFNIDFFGFKTLERAYLLKINGEIVETPQHMFLRVAIGMWGDNFKEVQKVYDDLSTKKYTHATPTLFNSGTRKPQMSSCFLLGMEDSIKGIYSNLSDCADISQSAGGIGMHISNIRAKGSYIAGTNGTSNGIIPMLKVYNETARYVDQCFTANTNIITDNGIKKISDINRGDKVLTDDGLYNTVNETRIYEKESKEVLEISTHGLPTRVTDIHPLLGIKLSENSTPKRELGRLMKGLNKSEYFEAKELKKGDYLGRVIPKSEKDVENLSIDDFRFYGILLGDGSISKGKNECCIYLGTEEKGSTINFVKNYLKQNFIDFSKTIEGSVTKFYIYLPTNSRFKFNRNDLYNSIGEKRINHNYLNIGKQKSIALLKGLIETDGSVKDDRIMFYNSSKPLVDGLDYIVLRLELPLYITERNRIGEVSSYKNIETKKLSYECEIPKTSEMSEIFGVTESAFFKYLLFKGVLYTKISNIEYISENTKVTTYDLCVDNNHTYTTQLSTNTNGGGKRKGSIATYIEPWHADIFDFLDLRKNTGKEEMRARDLFLALWIPDLFMKRVEEDGYWTLMCPNEYPNLYDVFDSKENKAFTNLYESYERDVVETSENESELNKKRIKARDLWESILEAQIETGTPYMLYKDAANSKSNQQNVGTIRSSNLCTEIVQYSDSNESAVCNLASIALPSFVEKPSGRVKSKDKKLRVFNHDALYDATYQVTKNLNRVIDVNYYPTEKTRKSNMRHRPIGIGIQGLADVFALLGYPFESKEAMKLNKEISETIYFASLTASKDLAKKDGTYETYEGSPMSKGLLQFDMWELNEGDISERWDWVKLRKEISNHGVRNSLLVAPMPTASTSQILGNNECFEPYTTNIYKRNTIAGEFPIINKHLIEDLILLDLWDDKMQGLIMNENGSVQNIPNIPTELKERYKTVWEMKSSNLLRMSRDRGLFTCQSQSMNIFMRDVNSGKLSKAHMFGWKLGLKTGMYYLRSNSNVEARKSLGVETNTSNDTSETIACSLDSPDDCLMCGS